MTKIIKIKFTRKHKMDDLEGLDFNIRIDSSGTTNPTKQEVASPDLWRDDSELVSSPVLTSQNSDASSSHPQTALSSE